MDSIFIIFIFFKIRIHSSLSFKLYSFLFDQTGRFFGQRLRSFETTYIRYQSKEYLTAEIAEHAEII